MSDEIKKEDEQILVEKVREIERQKKSETTETDKINTAKILREKTEFSAVMSDDEAKRRMRSMSRRGFLIGGAAAVAGYFGYGWLKSPEQNWIFHRAFKFNEDISQTLYSPERLAPEFSRESVTPLRVNGGEGMSAGFDPAKWRLQIVGVENPEKFPQFVEDIAYETAMDGENKMPGSNDLHETPDAKQNPNAAEMPPATVDRAAAMQMKMPGLLLTLDDLKTFPRVEMTTELKCIEGWSAIVNWAGVRFSDFAARFAPAARQYVSLVTPDGGYFVGMDLPSMLHPQTLLCYEMNGAPLALEHGAPLRLVTTTKYGIKQIKRIGRISFTAERPADFWNQSGYDWYSGH
jgi:hypothetical protein